MARAGITIGFMVLEIGGAKCWMLDVDGFGGGVLVFEQREV